MSNNNVPHKILIVGGGFGGIRVALDLDAQRLPNTTITLVSNKTHFEYHAALYRVVTGRSPLEVCIPIEEMIKGTRVQFIHDTVTTVTPTESTLHGSSGSTYAFDTLILALGSETMYFDIPGLKDHSFGFTSISEALRLKRHLHEQLLACKISPTDKDDDVCRTHIVIIGAGASGTELAGELASYTRQMSRKHSIDPSLITIDLIEAAPRILPLMPEDMSERVLHRLRHLGVNIFLNRTVVKEEVEGVYLRDMQMKTKTVIWTAGAKPAHLYGTIPGLEYDKKGRVVVNEFLQAKGFPSIYVIGDGASTQYTGMAQTALHDASSISAVIAALMRGAHPPSYQPKKPFYAIPVGPGWAAVLMFNLKLYGRIGWWLRRIADLRFFLSVLSPTQALRAFQNGKTLCSTCAICLPEDIENTTQ